MAGGAAGGVEADGQLAMTRYEILVLYAVSTLARRRPRRPDHALVTSRRATSASGGIAYPFLDCGERTSVPRIWRTSRRRAIHSCISGCPIACPLHPPGVGSQPLLPQRLLRD